MASSEINVGALGCMIASMQRALEYAIRLDERCNSDARFDGRNVALLESFQRDMGRAGRHMQSLLRDAPSLPVRRQAVIAGAAHAPPPARAPEPDNLVAFPCQPPLQRNMTDVEALLSLQPEGVVS